MANIDEELRLANEASAVIEKKSKEILEILRKAAFMARTQQTATFPSGAALNKARRKVGNALATLIPALEANRETPTRINKAKVAIDDWIKEIKAAKP